MSREFRTRRNVFPQFVQRFALVALGCLLLVAIAAIIFIYQVSPLRDPSFQPDSANAGSLIPWARGINETTWLLGSAVMAGLLTTNLLIIFWQWSQPRIRSVPQILLFVIWIGIGTVFFSCLHLMFTGYLLAQWLVD